MPEKVNANFIDHISIACFDVVQAENDYMATFGWEVAERYFDEDSHINVTCFAVGLTTVEVMEDEYSGGWYELQDMNGNVVISGSGSETKWVKKSVAQEEGKMADVGYWITKANNGRRCWRACSWKPRSLVTRWTTCSRSPAMPCGVATASYWWMKRIVSGSEPWM